MSAGRDNFRKAVGRVVWALWYIMTVNACSQHYQSTPTALTNSKTSLTPKQEIYPTPTSQGSFQIHIAPIQPLSSGAGEIPFSDLLWLPDRQLALSSNDGVIISPIPSSETQLNASSSLQSYQARENRALFSASHSGSLLAWVEDDSNVVLWYHTASPSPEAIVTGDSVLTGLSVDPDETKLAVASFDGSITFWAIPQKDQLISWDSGSWLANLSFSPDGKSFAGVDITNFRVNIYSMDGTLQRQLEWFDSVSPALYAAYFSPDWTKLAWVAREAVQIMEVESGNLGALLTHKDFIGAAAWAPDSKRFATVSANASQGSLSSIGYIWDTNSGNLLDSLPVSTPIQSIGFSPDGADLALLDTTGIVQIWKLNP